MVRPILQQFIQHVPAVLCIVDIFTLFAQKDVVHNPAFSLKSSRIVIFVNFEDGLHNSDKNSKNNFFFKCHILLASTQRN